MRHNIPVHKDVCRTSVLWEKWYSLVQTVMSQGWFPEALGSSGGRDLKTTPLPPGDGVKCSVLNGRSFCLWRSRWNSVDTPYTHLSHLLLLLDVEQLSQFGATYSSLPTGLFTCTLVMAFPSAWCCLWVVPRTLLLL